MFRSAISIKRDLGGLREVAPLHNLLRDQSGEAFSGAAYRLDPVALEPLGQIGVAKPRVDQPRRASRSPTSTSPPEP